MLSLSLKNIYTYIIGLSFAVLFVEPVYSLGINYNVQTGIEFTDNSLLTKTNKKNELQIRADVGFSLTESTPTLIYNLTPSIERIEYTKNTLNNTTYYRVNSNLVWRVIPTSLSLNISNDYSVQEIDRFASNLPSNKQQVNIFKAGPALIFKINATNNLLLDIAFYDIGNEVTNTDNKREFYSIAIDHAISDSSKVSLNLTETLIKYKDTSFNNDVKVNLVYFDFSSRKSRSIYNLIVGLNKSEQISSKKVFDGNLFRFSWDYEINFKSTMFMSYRNEISDAVSDVNISNQLQSGVSNTANQTNSTIFKTERFYTSYLNKGSRFNTSISAFGERQDYESTRVDRRSLGWGINTEYNINYKTILIGSINYYFIKSLSLTEIKNNNTNISLGSRYRLTSSWNFITMYSNNNRSSNISSSNYIENVILFSLSYAGTKNNRVITRDIRKFR